MRPTIPEVEPLVLAYLNKPGNEVGGSLHIYTDDGNDEDHHIHFCWQRAIEDGDGEGAGIAAMLYRMTRTQRRKMYARSFRGSAPAQQPEGETRE